MAEQRPQGLVIRVLDWSFKHFWLAVGIAFVAFIGIASVIGNIVEPDRRPSARGDGLVTTTTVDPDAWLEQSEYEEHVNEDPSNGYDYEPPDYDAGFP